MKQEAYINFALTPILVAILLLCQLPDETPCSTSLPWEAKNTRSLRTQLVSVAW
jgi:hypothetical protein